MKEKIQELIDRTNKYYDLEDTAEWIFYNKNELFKILHEYSN